jgi:hypothetical protein
VAKHQEEYEKDRADKVEKMRIKEEAKQKRLNESVLRELQGRTTATMGPGAHKVEGSGARKMRKRVKDDIDDSENRSARAPVIPETTGSSKIPAVPDSNGLVCIRCKAGGHTCHWDENKTCLRCHRLHLGCEQPGTGGKEKGKEKAGVKKPQVGVTKKITGELEDRSSAIVVAITMGFAGINVSLTDIMVVLKQQHDYMAGAVGEIMEAHRHITWELERMQFKAQWVNDNMYAAGLEIWDRLMNFWNTCPLNIERVWRGGNWLEEVPEEHREEIKKQEEGENGSVREKTRGDEENGEDEETEVLQTLRSQK